MVSVAMVSVESGAMSVVCASDRELGLDQSNDHGTSEKYGV